ncbi:MAG: XdhC/CoxI family protein [Phycisphaerae bacterium]|nr:XdhC/CoxI family protein [Phycisphaerae bacterium]
MIRPADQLLALASATLAEGRRAALCLVLSARGSTPQPAGAAMVVAESGATAGTIGGGCVEAEVRRAALLSIHEARGRTLTLRLDHDYGWDDGLICGGTMHVAVGLLDDRDAINRARADVAQGRPARVEFAADPAPGAPRHALVLPPPQRLLVAGAGHIGLALARLAIPLDFDVVVFDDRADLLARAAALGAATRPGPIADALAAEPIDPRTSCVIVTRGHRHDQSALRAVLRRGAAYVGMIGSRRKVLVIRRELARLGVPAESLASVHAPIGLDIGARTVEEIALAIAAQLVQVRAALAGPGPAPARPAATVAG